MRYEVGYSREERSSGYGTFRQGIADAIRESGTSVEHVEPLPMIDRMRLREGPITYRSKRHKFKRYLDERELIPAERRADNGPVTREGVCRLNLDLAERWVWDGAERRVGFTMWETDELPSSGDFAWLPMLRTAQTVIVPNSSNVELMREAGCQDVRRVPLAVDTDTYPYYDRTSRIPAIRAGTRPFIYLMLGELTYRKAFDLALSAFGQLWANDPTAWLVLKTRGQSPFMDRRTPDHRHSYAGAPYAWYVDREAAPNVLVLRGSWRRESIQRLYEAADCFLWPSRGEGYGLPPREAAATGLPVISTTHTGLEDAKRWALPIDSSTGGRAFFKIWGYCGRYQEPDEQQLVEAMRWVYDHYGQALAFGRSAREYLKQRTWQDVADETLAITREVRQHAA